MTTLPDPSKLRVLGDTPPAHDPEGIGCGMITTPTRARVKSHLEAHADHVDKLIARGFPEAHAKAIAARELDRRITMANDKARHADLVARHADHPILSALLSGHAPHEYGHADIYLECHGCPAQDHCGGEDRPEWPCPTWTTIAEQTERQS